LYDVVYAELVLCRRDSKHRCVFGMSFSSVEQQIEGAGAGRVWIYCTVYATRSARTCTHENLNVDAWSACAFLDGQSCVMTPWNGQAGNGRLCPCSKDAHSPDLNLFTACVPRVDMGIRYRESRPRFFFTMFATRDSKR
jgi:hypothetical protein